MDAELSVGGLARRASSQAAAIQLSVDTGGNLSPPVHSFTPIKSPSSSSPQPPSFSRRHSYNLAGSKPLRSSPLAGPAVSSNGSTLKPPVDIRHRTSSNPDLTAVAPPPHNKSTRPKSSQGFEPAAGPSRISPSADVSGLSDSPSRFSFISGLDKRRSKRVSASSSVGLELPPTPSPPVPEWARQHQIAHVERNRRPKSSHADLERNKYSKPRPTSTHGYPLPLNGSSSSLTVPVPPLPHSSHDASGSSWLTANTYDSTPKFSRLGLAASNVVLPVSARERRKSATSLKTRPSASSLTSSRSRSAKTYPSSSLSSHTSHTSHTSQTTSTAPSSPTSPSLTLTRSASDSSDDESLRAPTLIPGSNMTSSLSLEMATIVEGNEEPAPPPADPGRTRTFSITSLRKGTISRITRHKVKRSQSFNDVNVIPGRKPDGGVLAKTLSELGVHGESAPPVPLVANVEPREGEKPELSRKGGTIRRLWKTLSGKRWGRKQR